MKNWQAYYNTLLMTAEEAVSLIKSGDIIIDGHGHGRSPVFGPALMARASELADVKLVTGYNMTPSLHCDPKYSGHFRHVSVFNTAETRKAHWENRASFVPVHFSQMERMFSSWSPNVLFTQVTPPNEDGYVSMGVSCDFTRAMVDICPLVLAQVNPNMPWTNGDTVVPVEKFTGFIEAESDIPEIPEISADNVSDVERKIAMYIAEIIHDGDCLQTGVGAIPDTVLQFLSNHKHLGIHTELGSTGIMRLIEKGVIDNSKKTVDTNKVVCTLLGGTKEFYKFVDHNPDILLRKSSYVLHPANISRQKNMVAMNSAIQVDLFGQVNAEIIGGKQFSGVGGQLDFLRGAMMAEGGKSILCMPSTAAHGTVSRIVCNLDSGTAVTDTRYDTMYIVTEYGIADLWGKDNTQRANALINIAHPSFREQLEKDYWEKSHK